MTTGLRLRRLGLAAALGVGMLMPPAAGAADDERLVREAIDTFTRAAYSLDSGDTAAALQALDGMAASVATLRASAERYHGLARQMQSACEARSLAIITEIQTTYQQQKDKEKEVADVQALLENAQAQIGQLNRDWDELNARLAPMIEEAQFRNRCAGDGWFAFTTGRCYELSFRDLFENRWEHLNDQIAETDRRRQSTYELRGRLVHQRDDLAGQAARADNQAHQLEAQRRELQLRDAGARAAVVTLSNISLFWAMAETDIRRTMGGEVKSLRNLVVALKQEKPAPNFADFRIPQRAQSLEETMLKFARSLNSGQNFLISDAACK